MIPGLSFTNLPLDGVFSLASQMAMVGWLILTVAPRRWPIFVWLPKFIIPGALSALYSLLIISHFGAADGGFGSLDGVKTLFRNEYVLLAGWVHYLAFDLFIGAWIAERCDKLGFSRFIQPLFFAATFLFGPMGLLLFFITSGFYRQRDVSA